MVKTFPWLLVVEVKGLRLHWQRKEQVEVTWNVGLSHAGFDRIPKNTAANMVFRTEHCIIRHYNKGFLMMWNVNLKRAGTKRKSQICNGNLGRD